jgi:hypothetical protein
MAYIGFFISIAALAFSLFTYIKHDRKLKIQEERLKEYQLENLLKERDEKKKAIIEANIIKGEKGQRILKVYNRGKSIAKQVNVILADIEGVFVINNPSPIDIRPQNGIDIILLLAEAAPDIINIEFEWEDEYQEKNEDIQMVQLR